MATESDKIQTRIPVSGANSIAPEPNPHLTNRHGRAQVYLPPFAVAIAGMAAEFVGVRGAVQAIAYKPIVTQSSVIAKGI